MQLLNDSESRTEATIDNFLGPTPIIPQRTFMPELKRMGQVWHDDLSNEVH